MLIQILDTNQKESDLHHLKWFKEICDTWAIEFGMEKSKWLHTEIINFNSDVFFKSIDASRVLVGYKSDIKPNNSGDELRWLEIEIVGPIEFDAITQVLMVTIGMDYMRSVTGNFSTDWADIQTVFNHGSKGYCCTANWKDLRTVIDRIHAENGLSEPLRIMSSAMLLNEGLRIDDTFQHVADLSKTNNFSQKCLNILNVTTINELSFTNIFLFISNETNSQFIDISRKIDASTNHIKMLH